ncbi:hypothetical protein Agub_g8622, partial [Astrephomene gubernaculifera]
FGTAALCLRSATEEALSHAAAAAAEAAAGTADAGAAAAAIAAATDTAVSKAATAMEGGRCGSPPPRSSGWDSDGVLSNSPSGRAEWDTRLARSLQDSDGLVDGRLLELCCPAIEEASRVLQRAAAAAAAAELQLQQAGGGGAAGTPGAPGSRGGTPVAEPRPLMPRRMPPAALKRLGGGAGGGGGAGMAVAIPESVAAVLSAPGPSPLQQALAQALLGQYSTGEHAVPMRDVVSYVTGVLAVNGAAATLELIVP